MSTPFEPSPSGDASDPPVSAASDRAITDRVEGQGTLADDPLDAPAGQLDNATVLERTRAMWQEREPPETNDPVDHHVRECHTSPRGIRLIAASRRGRAHAHDGSFREDCFHVAVTDGWTLVAVADGAGSKPLARVGARLATRTAIDYLERVTREQFGPDEEIAPRLKGALAGALAQAVATLSEEAATRGRDVDDFASTLILLAYGHSPSTPWIGVAQVGDGGAAIRTQTECATLGQPDRGAFAGEALFLTSPETQLTWVRRASVYRMSHPPTALLVATDGVMDDFTPPLGALEALFIALEPLSLVVNSDQWLLDWLGYERRGSFDDRTLVVVLPPTGPDPLR
ncbi:MAG TPA: PP2C family serine/threonine-protein phosphatase [Acidimicrobiales bacterium]|nr:PP2C family serine/threonine-protein phosphatase [Acidimicrobiales bacterium]